MQKLCNPSESVSIFRTKTNIVILFYSTSLILLESSRIFSEFSRGQWPKKKLGSFNFDRKEPELFRLSAGNRCGSFQQFVLELELALIFWAPSFLWACLWVQTVIGLEKLIWASRACLYLGLFTWAFLQLLMSSLDRLSKNARELVLNSFWQYIEWAYISARAFKLEPKHATALICLNKAQIYLFSEEALNCCRRKRFSWVLFLHNSSLWETVEIISLL